MKRLILLLPALLALASCGNAPKDFAEINGFTQGSTYHIVFEYNKGFDLYEIRNQVESWLAEVDNSLSIYKDTSVISLINRNISNKTDSLFRDVYRQSREIWEQSGGAFDITVGPLVKTWGFGPDATRRFDPSKLDSLLALVGMDKTRLQGDMIIKADPDIFIDVNAIAQGYTVDLIVNRLRQMNIDNCLVEVGGEVRASGDKEGEGWRIGIDTPEEGNDMPGVDVKAIIRLKDLASATSGNYRKFYLDNGIKYSHTIDPRTGYPARQSLLSATILAKECSTADAWATACMVEGLDKARAFIEGNKSLEGYLIYSDEQGRMKTWMSDGVRDLITEE